GDGGSGDGDGPGDSGGPDGGLPPASAVPLPGTLTLLGLGLAGIAGSRTRGGARRRA
ncbi:MAG: PEP-CTERM sorting domain-containing protein, partial [Limnobacter sp.]|nr:PEP-CTERM sorting domain-containing protein [Limnobacter sp.]